MVIILQYLELVNGNQPYILQYEGLECKITLREKISNDKSIHIYANRICILYGK